MHCITRKCVYLIMSIMLGIVSNINMSSKAAVTPPPTYSLDAKSHVITIHHDGDAAQQINSALGYLANRTDKSTLWTVKFDAGPYYLSQGLFAEKLENVALESDRQTPAILVKAGNFSSEYLFYTRFSKNVTVRGFDFYGSSRVYNAANYTSDPTAPVWRDQGLYFGSCNGVTVNMNRFFNFGNAAVRITTTERDPVPGVNSFNTQVTQNYFNNVFQVTTTSNDTVHGGSANYLFQGNTFDYLRGSVKFATRTPGANTVYVRYNNIRSSSTDGLEIVGYVNMEISHNEFHHIARNAVNCYSNELAASGFQWGDSLIFKNNVIDATGGGIRISADTFSDGFQPKPKNVQITDNSISNLTGNAPAITLLHGPFIGLKVTNNKFSHIPSKKYIYLQEQDTDADLSGNTVDSALLTATK